MRETVARLGLDLSDLEVLTEAGSGYFAVTPVLAAVAGAARVVAVTRDSRHGPAECNATAVAALAALCEVDDRVTVVTSLDASLVGRADIVTNLGFVRPIDALFVSTMKETAVVPLMCEAWEWRPADVDLDACRRRGVVVLATNEDDDAVDVFSYSGLLAVKLVLEAGVEVYKSRVVVYGRDRFAPVLVAALGRAGAAAEAVDDLRSPSARAALSAADVLLVADYLGTSPVIGPGGAIEAAELARLSPGITVVQFAGAVDAPALADAGLPLHPAEPVGPHRMSRTLAHLGPRPVIELHAAGLKVGELAARARRAGLSASEAEEAVLRRSSLAQRLPV